MSDLKLAIKDFEAIESLQVIFKNGFTCITGASNNGKSSIFRAIYYLLYNKHTDNSIQQGKESYTIGLEYNNNKVLCKRNTNKTMKTAYQVNGKNITKVGRNNIDEVDEALNMALVDLAGTKVELNITEQFAYPFMLDLPPGKLYTFLSQSSTQEDLYTVIKDMKKDLKDIDDRRKKLEGTVELAKNSHIEANTIYSNLVSSEVITADILNLQSEVNYVYNLDNICSRLSLCDSELLNCDVKLQSIREQLDIVEPLDALIDEVNSLDILRKDMTKMKEKLLKHKDVNQTYNILTTMVSKLDFESIENLFKDIDSIENILSSLTHKLDTLNNRTESLVSYEEVLSKVNNQLQDTTALDGLYEGYLTLVNLVSNINQMINKISMLDTELVQTVSNLNDIDTQLDDINRELLSFDKCPLCGKEM